MKKVVDPEWKISTLLHTIHCMYFEYLPYKCKKKLLALEYFEYYEYVCNTLHPIVVHTSYLSLFLH